MALIAPNVSVFSRVPPEAPSNMDVCFDKTKEEKCRKVCEERAKCWAENSPKKNILQPKLMCRCLVVLRNSILCSDRQWIVSAYA